MNKTASWMLTPSYTICFVLVLLFCHPLHVIGKLISDRMQRRASMLMCRLILLNLRLHGTKYSIKLNDSLPLDRPLIFVSNHQSMYDIPLFIHHYRRLDPKFISKKELAKGIPSISHDLKVGGHLLIDRKDPRTALPAIREFGEFLNANNMAVSIFPEGTRGRDGKLKHFKPGGLNMLIKSMPDALIVPVVIDGMWEILRYHFKPYVAGVRVVFKTLESVEPSEYEGENLAAELENRIRCSLDEVRGEVSPEVVEKCLNT